MYVQGGVWRCTHLRPRMVGDRAGSGRRTGQGDLQVGGWGLCCPMWTSNFEEGKHPKSEPGLPSCYEGIFVKVGGQNIF